MKVKLVDSSEQRIFVTSDIHLRHKNILQFQPNREFNDSMEMEEAIIKSWNETVRPNDIVFNLGDFCFGNKSKWLEVLNQLNGFKYYCIGNHDHLKDIPKFQFVEVDDYFDVRVTFADKMDDVKYKFIMSHYPFFAWDDKRHGSIMLHGHLHSLTQNKSHRIVDVGWDFWGRVVPLNEILESVITIDPNGRDLSGNEYHPSMIC